MKILNFGSLNIDYVYEVDHFVRPGETLSSSNLNIFCGGKGLNQSIALARSGATVYHAGSAGKSDGDLLVEMLQKNQINVDFVNRPNVLSGHAMIQVDKKGQNCILLYGGANHSVTKQQVDDVLKNFSAGDYLVLQNEINLLDYVFEQAHKKGMIIVLNPSPINQCLMELPLEQTDYLILNEVEAADLTGEQNKENLLDALKQKYPKTKIVLTLGKLGACCFDGKNNYSHGIYQVKVVDTTAAGDTFTGFFIGSIAQGKRMEEALEIASIASSLAVSKKGAEASIPTYEQVKQAKTILKPIQ